MQRWERSLRGHLPSLASCIYVVVRGMAVALPGSRVPRRDARTLLWARGSVMDALHMDFSLSPRTLSCRPGCLVGWRRRLSVIRWGRRMCANSVGRKSRRYSSVKPEGVRELYLQNLESRDGSPAGAACEPRRNRVCVAMHQKNGQNGSCISKNHRKRSQKKLGRPLRHVRKPHSCRGIWAISCPFFRGQEVTVNTAGHFAVQTPQPGGLASSSYRLHRWENVTGSEGETLIEKIFSMLSGSKTWCAAAWTRFSMPWVWL